MSKTFRREKSFVSGEVAHKNAGRKSKLKKSIRQDRRQVDRQAREYVKESAWR